MIKMLKFRVRWTNALALYPLVLSALSASQPTTGSTAALYGKQLTNEILAMRRETGVSKRDPFEIVAKLNKGIDLCIDEKTTDLEALVIAHLIGGLILTDNESRPGSDVADAFEQAYHRKLPGLLAHGAVPPEKRDLLVFLEIEHGLWHARVAQMIGDVPSARAALAATRRNLDALTASARASLNKEREFAALSNEMYAYGPLLEQMDEQEGERHWHWLAASADARASSYARERIEEGELLRKYAITPVEWKFTALDGSEVDLAAWRGKVVLIDCWATWCGPCVQGLPEVKALYDRWHAAGLEVVGLTCENAGISSNDSPKERERKLTAAEVKLKQFVSVHKLSWPQYFDGSFMAKTTELFRNSSIPRYHLFGPDGKLLATGNMYAVKPALEGAMASLKK